MLTDLNLKIAAVIAFAVWNIIVFAIYGLDKRKAKLKKAAYQRKNAYYVGIAYGRIRRVFRYARVPAQNQASGI